MTQFVHLHVHTQYSILDGAASISSLVAKAKADGMPALAVTDHGNMYGAKEFYDTATKAGIKPIFGCEVYMVKDRFQKSKATERRHHLLLLAKNERGYHNLIKLVSLGFTDGYFDGRARIDAELLTELHEDIICCSACIAGEVPRAIINDDMVEAERVARWFKELFGDDYYFEMQLFKPLPGWDQGAYPKQVKANEGLMALSKKLGIKVVCTNDVHFTDADDAEPHDHLICLNTGKLLNDEKRMRYSGQEYFKTTEQMADLFAHCPEALANTIEIANKVEEFTLNHDPLMPNFPIPEDLEIDYTRLRESFLKKIKDEAVKARMEAYSGEELEQAVVGDSGLEKVLMVAKQYMYLRHLTYKGAHERWGETLDEKIIERLEYELGTIEWMGFPGYFLIVWDYIRAAREMGVSVGPGRGSAAGSAVAYSLRITNIDPIAYDLLFERFLNPDRISLPDVDVDFDEDGRALVLDYVVKKYGQKRVAQIVTFGTMAPKLAIKDVARVQDLPLAESNRLTKLVPDKLAPAKGQSPFEWVYQEVPELAKERKEGSELVQKTLANAEKLEGSVRQTGVHACGVIIGQDDIEKFAPVAVAKDADLNVVQFEGKHVESVGLIKMDFLGLTTLSIIKDALANIKHTTGKVIDIDNVTLDDKKTYELFSQGLTTGVFQFESPGMKKHLRALKPTRLEDLIAMNALYRPGPMEKIPNFIARKHGQEPVTYEFPEMEKYLADTYGITVYQEQVMLLSQLLAGFTGGEADTLRKAMGKKQKAVLDKMKPKFIDGAVERGHDKAICEKIWTEWEAFASYAFNKSHATCYAYVAYQTAYLKAHYPSEFMAAVLSRNLTKMDKIVGQMDECKRMGIRVLGPDVNESYNTFIPNTEGNIRFGLAGVKGVGDAAVTSIVNERNEGGKFKDLYDFFERVNYGTVNRKVIENMAISGAFDSLSGMHRSRLLIAPAGEGSSFLDQLVRYGSRYQSEKNNSQQSLFGGFDQVDLQRPEPPVVEEWTTLETLNAEHELIGMYISSHPLDDYKLVINNMCNTQIADFGDLPKMGGKDFTTGGVITTVRNGMTRTQKPYGSFVIEDYSGSHEFTLFDKDYENFRKFLYKDYFLMLRGTVQPRRYNDKEFEVKFKGMVQLHEVLSSVREMTLTIDLETLTPEFVKKLSDCIAAARKVKKGEATADLKVRVVDSKSGVSLPFLSKGKKMKVTTALADLCDEYDIKFILQ